MRYNGIMRFGALTLTSNLFLSPLAGYTNCHSGSCCANWRLGLATTDLVNARSLIEKKAKALKLVETSPADRPLAVQLFGAVPGEMRDAAVYSNRWESLRWTSTWVAGAQSRSHRGGSAMMTSWIRPPTS